ncbi:MAG: DUF4367 domain-containing protein [Oscillospiraceae bacterium]|nr:DUF4367 domain-containing protein [Oscillospiraceae bacterium]
MSNHQSRDFSRYDSMTSEELEEILRADIDAPEGTESDTEMLFYVMEVLADRRRNSANPGKTPEEAWKSFVQNYLPSVEGESAVSEAKEKPKASPPRWLRRLTAAAAAVAIVLGCTVTASALGFDVLDVIVKWTKETFQFGTSNQVNMAEPIPNDSLEYASLQEALEMNSITTELAPIQFPVGSKLVDIKVVESPIQKVFTARYLSENGEIKIQIKGYIEGDPEKIEQSGTLEETYMVENIEYYIFKNNDLRQAVWINGNYECIISGALSIDELKAMIDSV